MRKSAMVLFAVILLLPALAAFAQDSLFAPAVNYGVGICPISVFGADLDGDGHNDLAVANDTSNTVSILINNGNGTFRAAANYAVGYMPFSVFAADLDGDGDNDLAVSSFVATVSILINNGDGTFQDTVNYSTGTQFAEMLYAADLDGDGDMDLGVAIPNPFGAGHLVILFNNGNGTFQPAVSYPTSGNSISVFAADLDGDGDNDLAVTNGMPGNVDILRNNGNGTFQAAVSYTTGLVCSSVYAADLDGDGDKDLAATDVFANYVSILRNNGDGTFQAAVNYGAGNGSVWVFASDLDGDGDKDLAVANAYSNNVSILRNNGNGTFQAAVNYGAGSQPVSVFAVDLDGDGDNDLAVANEVSNNVSILLNRTIQVGIDDEPASFPAEYKPSQSYPNPFNAQTTIRYSLPKQSIVSIDIFDILGRKIETLDEEIQSAGEHQTTWDAEGQSSGIYFYRINTGEYAETKRTVLMK